MGYNGDMFTNAIISVARKSTERDTTKGYPTTGTTTILEDTLCLLGQNRGGRRVFFSGNEQTGEPNDSVSIYKRLLVVIKEGDIATISSAGVLRSYVIESVRYSQSIFSNHVTLGLKAVSEVTTAELVGSFMNDPNVEILINPTGSHLLVSTVWAKRVLTSNSTGATVYTIPTNANIKQVFVGGVLQEEAEYTFTATQLTLLTPPPTGVEITIFYFGN